MKKYVDGVLVDLTAEEIAEFNQRLADAPSKFDMSMTNLRLKRDNLLTESDWTQSPDSPLTDAKKTEWATYRTSLRNLTNGLTTVEQVEDVTWPTKPN